MNSALEIGKEQSAITLTKEKMVKLYTNLVRASHYDKMMYRRMRRCSSVPSASSFPIPSARSARRGTA